MAKITYRVLRAMADRWQRDLDRVEAEWGTLEDKSRMDTTGAQVEIMRNLGSAIAWTDQELGADKYRPKSAPDTAQRGG